jgi:hypothetical protein
LRAQREAIQKTLHGDILDCFVASLLAMTVRLPLMMAS